MKKGRGPASLGGYDGTDGKRRTPNDPLFNRSEYRDTKGLGRWESDRLKFQNRRLKRLALEGLQATPQVKEADQACLPFQQGLHLSLKFGRGYSPTPGSKSHLRTE